MAIKICIDPGHVTKYNRGAYLPYYEGDKMYDLAIMLKEELEKYEGVTAIITRKNVYDNPELWERARMALNNDCRLFLSLHTNAAASESIKDVTLIRSIEMPESEALAWKLVDAIYNIVSQDVPTTKYKKIYTRTLASGKDYYGVLRHSCGGCVKESLIIEHVYHTNYKQAEWMYDNNNLRKLAIAEAKVIAFHYGHGKLKSQNTTQNTVAASNTNTYINYTIQKGDSWWGIAAKQCGSGLKMAELASYNGKTIFSTINPGQIIRIPITLLPEKKYYEYTIQKGDSWWGIAKSQLGSGARYKELADYNNLSTDAVINPGQVIRIPK